MNWRTHSESCHPPIHWEEQPPLISNWNQCRTINLHCIIFTCMPGGHVIDTGGNIKPRHCCSQVLPIHGGIEATQAYILGKEMAFVRVMRGFTDSQVRYCWCTGPKLQPPQWPYVGMKEASCCITAVQDRPASTPRLNSKAPVQLNPLGVFGLWRDSIGIMSVESGYTCIQFFSTL